MTNLLNIVGVQKKKNDAPLILTDQAIQKIKDHQQTLAEARGKCLRIYITAGGCSGFSYNFKYDDPKENDLVFEKDGAKCIVDPKSYGFIAGSTLTYQEGLTGAGFVVKNPNETGGCGCGSSFSVS
ncbi:MAG: iron-sulfur cluster assembly accessory protein [Deltaproteobacteria bacterium]|nr:iron-sulfur cluster assembly accessory protein [Deltaproteobacteria bacterium]